MTSISITERICEIYIVIITYGYAIKIIAILQLRTLYRQDDAFRKIRRFDTLNAIFLSLFDCMNIFLTFLLCVIYYSHNNIPVIIFCKYFMCTFYSSNNYRQ